MTRRRSDAGFSLVVLIFFATAASILLTAAIPAYQMQARREREEELIFRGEEYMRAIQKYQKRFGIYPPSLDALQQANGMRFIRRLYTDPTSDKPFRLIYLNPDGSLTGSTVFSQRVVNAPPSSSGPLTSNPISGSTPPAGAGPPQQSGASPSGGTSAFGGASPSGGTSAFGGASPSGGTSPPSGTSASGGSRPLSGASPSGGTPPRTGAPSAGSPSARPTTQSGTNQTFGTSGIIGVASDTEETSIKVYRGREKYNEWEFIAISGQPGTTPFGATPPPGATGAPPPPGATPGFGTPSPSGATPGFGTPSPSGATPGFGAPPPTGATPGTGKAPPLRQ